MEPCYLSLHEVCNLEQNKLDVDKQHMQVVLSAARCVLAMALKSLHFGEIILIWG